MLHRNTFASATLSFWVVLTSLLPCSADAAISLEAPSAGNDATPSVNSGSTRVFQSAAKDLLADKKYRFCNDADYRLFKLQKAEFCHTAEESANVCPGLVAACARPAWDEQYKKSEGSFSLPGASWFALLVQLLFWGALAAGLGMLLWSAWKVARSQSLDFAPEKKEPRPLEQQLSVALLETGPSREELMRLAQLAVSEDRGKDALLFLYRATLQGLGDLGWIRLRRSATSGDYGRSMRARLRRDQGETIGAAHEVEAAIAHLSALERERFMQLERTSETLSLLQSTQIILRHWSTLMVCLLAIVCQGCGAKANIENPDDPASPGGTLLFEEMIGQRANSSQRRFRRVESVDADTTAVVAMGAELSNHEWGVLSSWVLEGGALVVTEPSEAFAESFDVAVSRTACSGEFLTEGYHVAPAGKWEAFDKLDPDESYFVCGEHAIVAGIQWGQGWVTLIASHNLVQNGHLAEAEHATLIMESVLLDGAEVELLGPWTGRGATSPLQSLMQGDFAWWVLHALLFFVVAAWGLGRRFGKPSDPPRLHRRAFREHALALAAQYQRVGAHGFALKRFAEWSSEQLHRSGVSGAKLRQGLNAEFSTALNDGESPGPSTAASDNTKSRTMNIFRKLRDVPGRRLKVSSRPSTQKR